jgi:hypothetical protein
VAAEPISQNQTAAMALDYAARGWPVLALEPGGKAPLTNRKACPHGVKDATTDPGRIKSWLWRFPDANIGVATGAPGPQVQDVDDLAAARDVMARIPPTVPRASTPRTEPQDGGVHYYFAGTRDGTRGRGWGELRGRGSYAVVPPSVVNGRAYRWVLRPDGPLPELPELLIPAPGTGAGCGEHVAPDGLVPHGARHLYLVGFAVHLLKGGITDGETIEWHLRAEFERKCEPLPEPKTIPGIARWAASSDIARRERGSRG